MSVSVRTVEFRFWRRFVVDDSGCWLWAGEISRRGGYGRITVNGKGRQAHRVAYELVVGPIPEGLTLDHLCRTPACVNPAHLEPVTNRENILRGTSWAAENARKTHCIHGHEFTPENTLMAGPDRARRECKTCRRNRERARGPRDRTAARLESAA